MLPTLLLGLALTSPPSPYNLCLGLSELDWEAIVSNTGGQVTSGYVVRQILRTPQGQTLAVWTSTKGLDPKGPNGLGVQLYGADGSFWRWLDDARNIDRDFMLCGRYLVGGGNTLRVWETEGRGAGTALARRAVSGLKPSTRLSCQGGVLSLLDPALRLRLPELTPLR